MPNRHLILAGDIGGTKTNLALFSVEANKLRPVQQSTFPSKNYSGLVPVIREFIEIDKYRIDAATFGIAGPVVDGVVKTPNLPWLVERDAVQAVLTIKAVELINDLEATAYGIFTLDETEFVTLNDGIVFHSGTKALIAAGTGLGESILYYDGAHFRPLASEGGHADFAPTNELEIELLRYLIGRYEHVSYERVLSGPGLVNIYQFLRDSKKFEEPKWLTERFASGEDPGAVVTKTALAKEAEISVQAMEIFVSVYGAEAGNLALRAKSVRGLYVGGGIAPKILPKLKDGTFMRAFGSKGRYTELLAEIPVQVILNEQTALRGAAYHAAFIQ
jgi:glucokinase